MSDTDSANPVVFVVFTSILILFSISSNILVIVSVVRFRKLRKVPNVLISNLAVSDILLAGLYIPQKLHDLFHTDDYFEGNFLCKFVNFVPVLLVTSSCYTLVCISFERCRTITTSHKPQFPMTFIRKVIVGIWILSFVIASPTLLEYSTGTHEFENHTFDNLTIVICSNGNMPKVFIVANGSLVLILSFLIPLILVFCNYARLAWFIHERGRKLLSGRNKVTPVACTKNNQQDMLTVTSFSGRMNNGQGTSNVLGNAGNKSMQSNIEMVNNQNRINSSLERKGHGLNHETTAQYVLDDNNTSTSAQESIRAKITDISSSPSKDTQQAICEFARRTDNQHNVNDDQTVDKSYSRGLNNDRRVTGVSWRNSVEQTTENNVKLLSTSGSKSTDRRKQTRGGQLSHKINTPAVAISQLSKHRMRLVNMMVVVAVFFAISWIPFFVLYMYMKITGKDASKDVGSAVGLCLITLATISTAYNVIIYVIFNQNFRQAFNSILKCTWKQLPNNHMSQT